MPVHLILQRALANLVEAVKLKGYRSAVRPDDAVERDGEAFLIGSRDGLNSADHAGAPGDQDPLAVRGIERDGDVGEDRTGGTRH